jgi:ABC-type transport system involved in cytochrome bd biosynthesis fused ATPase/permease subunit
VAVQEQQGAAVGVHWAEVDAVQAVLLQLLPPAAAAAAVVVVVVVVVVRLAVAAFAVAAALPTYGANVSASF